MTDASRTLIGNASGTGIIGELTQDWDNDILYMVSSQNQNLITLDIKTGQHTIIGQFGLASNPIRHGLEYVPDIGKLFGHSGGLSHGFHLYDINKNTGEASCIATSAFTSFHNLGYNSHTGVMYLMDNSQRNLYTLNLDTGLASVVGNLGSSNFLSLAYIPALRGPGGLVMLAAAGFIGSRRRR